jgi:hypothetical protein
MTEYDKLIEYIFYGLISAVAIYIAHSIKEMKTSIESLNIAFATEMERISNVRSILDKHEKYLEKHNDKIIELEKHSFRCNNVLNTIKG